MLAGLWSVVIVVLPQTSSLHVRWRTGRVRPDDRSRRGGPRQEGVTVARERALVLGGGWYGQRCLRDRCADRAC